MVWKQMDGAREEIGKSSVSEQCNRCVKGTLTITMRRESGPVTYIRERTGKGVKGEVWRRYRGTSTYVRELPDREGIVDKNEVLL